MPDLDEQSMMDMPTTVPRASIAEVERDLRVRDEILRGFPEVWQVVGQGGPRRDADRLGAARHDRDRHQPARPRGLAQAEAPVSTTLVAQTRVVLDALVAKGLVRPRRRPRSGRH